jgi:hypothetical protein
MDQGRIGSKSHVALIGSGDMNGDPISEKEMGVLFINKITAEDPHDPRQENGLPLYPERAGAF